MNVFRKSIALTSLYLLLSPVSQVYAQIDIVVDVNTNTPEAAVAGALAELCPRLETYQTTRADILELKQFCNELLNADPDQAAAAYRALSSRAATSQTTMMMHGPASLPVEVDKRMQTLRKAAQSGTNARMEMQVNGNTLLTGLVNDTGGGASADPQKDGRLSGFATALYTDSEQTQTATLAGFTGKTYAAVFGVDYRFLDNAFAGVAMRYANSSVDLSANAGSLDAKDFNLTAYGTYYPQTQWYLDWTVHYGQGDFDLNRRIKFTLGALTVNKSAGSNTGSSQYGASVGGGYEWVFTGGALAQLNANLRYNTTTSDSYNESAAGGYNLHIDEQSISNTLGSIGAQGSKAFSYPWGVLMPQINLNYFHEFTTDGEPINASFVADPFNTQFTFTTEDRDSSYYTAALGVVAQFPGGFTAYLQNETYFQLENYKQSAWSLGARMEF